MWSDHQTSEALGWWQWGRDGGQNEGQPRDLDWQRWPNTAKKKDIEW